MNRIFKDTIIYAIAYAAIIVGTVALCVRSAGHSDLGAKVENAQKQEKLEPNDIRNLPKEYLNSPRGPIYGPM